MVATNLKFYRDISFLKQSDVAKGTGIPQYVISRFENGIQQPTDEEAKKLADFFDITPDLLCGGIVSTPITNYLRQMNAIGRLFAVKEEHVMEDLHLTERAIRKYVERERMAGNLICNEQDGRGYYLASSPAEANRFIRKSMRMVRSLSRQCKQFRDYIKINGETPCA